MMGKAGSSKSKMNIAIIHPDLGIGGAERLIVDAAQELASHGHKVHIFTAHHDNSRCFEETLTGTFAVTVYGAFLPRHIFYGFHAICAYLRCIFVALSVLFLWPSFDVILADQVSVVVPLLKLKRSMKVVFYCHFPDMLLAQHTTFIRKIYRKPIDFIEEMTTGLVLLYPCPLFFFCLFWPPAVICSHLVAVSNQIVIQTAGMADLILVNSKFTASTFANTFKCLHARGISPAVLYPAVNLDQFHEPYAFKKNFLSINRYERKKNIELAISAFSMLHSRDGNATQGDNSDGTSLTIVGGFDKRLKENVEYLEELKALAEREGVSPLVNFITSCSTAERNTLLSQCLCVIYTPKDEHFGIVPLEAMASHKPVIACNSGGPVETIKNGVTGFLCEPTAQEFSLAMRKLLEDHQMAENMGHEAQQHVATSFSTKIFGIRLDRFLLDVARGKRD